MTARAIGQAEACVFSMACSLDKAVQLRKESQNDHSKGKNDCPESVDKAVEMMRNHRGTVSPQKFKKSSNNDNKNHNNNDTQNNEQHHESVGFAQVVAGNDGKYIKMLSVMTVRRWDIMPIIALILQE